MRILIVHNTLNDSTSINGVLRHYAYMANEWIASGHQTDFVVAKAGWPQLKQLAPRSKLLNSDGLFDATRYLAKTWRYFPAYGYRLATAHWLRLEDHYDVVVSSAQLIMEVYPALVLARRQKARFAVKIHHILAAQPGRKGLFDRMFLLTERQCVRWINRYGDPVICSTHIVAKDYHVLEARLGLPPKPTVQIGYGTDLLALMPQTSQPKVYDAVFLGRLHEHKGVFDLPHFWRKVVSQRPLAKLLVIGEGPHRQRTAELFQELGLGASVTFTGGISESAKNDYLAQCRLGLSLSYEEGWGLSVMEFLAAGLPVVAYDLPVFGLAFPGLLELVKLGDWEGLSQLALALLQDEPRQLKQGHTGREYVQRYDFRQIARTELEALINGV